MQAAESHSPALTPEERFREIAKILAKGVLRLRRIPIAVPLESPSNCLDVPSHEPPSVPAG